MVCFVDAPQRSLGNVRKIIARQVFGVFGSVSLCAALSANLETVNRHFALEGCTVTPHELAACELEVKRLENAVRARSEAALSRAVPSRVIRALSESVTDGVYVRTVSVRGAQVEISGHAQYERELSQFIARLEAQESLAQVVVVASEHRLDMSQLGLSFRVRAETRVSVRMG